MNDEQETIDAWLRFVAEVCLAREVEEWLHPEDRPDWPFGKAQIPSND